MAGAQTDQAGASNGWAGILPIIIAGGLFAFFLQFVGEVASGSALMWSYDWVPALGINLAFRVDGLALCFALLISGIGTTVLLYANTYLAGHQQYGRFALYLTAFMISMLGLVLSDDLILLFVFWELTTFTSYLLIGFSHEAETSRRNALQALFVTGAGGLAFLAGLIMLGFASGTNSISEIIAQGDAIKEHAMYLPIVLLLFAGAFTKSAQFPFHFWLPNAMAAPTPVSAFLHSATMVKAGVYLLARMSPALSGTEIWFYALTILGAITAVFASILALRQSDLKQALAYTTLMALGTLTLLLGQSSAYAMTAFAAFLIVHSLYKASLFLVVGCIESGTGTKKAEYLGGLATLMPVTALTAALAALSMAGLPPFIGFIGKELKYYGALEIVQSPYIIVSAVLLANALMFAIAGIVALRPFWGQKRETPKAPREAPWQMLAGPFVLAALGLVFGIFHGVLQHSMIDPIVASLTGGALEAKKLKLWGGVNAPLILSLVTFALGAIIYIAHLPLRRVLVRIFDALPSFDAGWDHFMSGLKAFAIWLTARIQTGRFTDYLAVTFASIAAAMIAGFVLRGVPDIWRAIQVTSWLHYGLALLIISGALASVVTRSRITAIASLGVVGIGIALVFVVFSAPDVAITQLLVETLVVVLVAVVMLRLPFMPAQRFRPFHALLSITVGAGITLVLLGVLASPLNLRLTEYFQATSWPEAYGRNIVNVILVDFRAIDTFGEIAVVVIAALSAYALLRTSKGIKR